MCKSICPRTAALSDICIYCDIDPTQDSFLKLPSEYAGVDFYVVPIAELDVRVVFDNGRWTGTTVSRAGQGR